jgi:hypothetical protein
VSDIALELVDSLKVLDPAGAVHHIKSRLAHRSKRRVGVAMIAGSRAIPSECARTRPS